uniref:Nucleoporin seh1-A n=1 Tax=Aceria tosichella TaxID=561515 RepID=A0A6G1SIR7_9ACAR
MDKNNKVNGAYIPRSVNAEFRDTITDISYDHFGHRLALSSTDHTIQIWDLSHDGTYHLISKFRSHSGSVWKVTWAHPEFGQILATCSLDRTAIIWEEVLDATVDTKRSSDQTSHWAKRATLVDSRTSLTDIRFAPKHLGLMLVTCATDGHVRIYEAPDITNISHWSLRDEFNCKMACSSITWNQSRIHPPMLAVGSDDANSPSPKVLIYEYNEHLRRWIKVDAVASATDPVHDLSFAPYIGRSYHLLGIASKNVQIVTIKTQSNTPSSMTTSSLTSSMVPQTAPLTPATSHLSQQAQPASTSRFDIKTVAQFDDHLSQVWRVSWNITGTILASSGDDGTVRMWKSNYLDNWKPLGVLNDNVGAQTSNQTGDHEENG